MHPRDAVSNWQRVTKNGTTELKRNRKIHSLHPIIERKIDREIVSVILPVLESWSGQKLSDYGTVYGRRYLRGASMLMHTVTKNSHLIGAILQIDQKVEKDWPLTLIDNEGQKKIVYL